MSRLYVDHAATTPMLPEVKAAMEPWLGAEYGNASSLYAEGRRARAAIDLAREALAEVFGCLFGEVLFTGSGTEAANTAILGAAIAALKNGIPRRTILLGAAEHHCVTHTAAALYALGFRVAWIPVDAEARVLPEALAPLLSDDVLLISVMHANNEVGGINDVPTLAAMAREHGIWVHCDAVQTFGQLEIGLDRLGVDILTVSGHKVYGPKGTGAMVLRSGVKIAPLLVGGGQEREMRAGTENVAAIVGFGEAVRRLTPTSPEARDAFWSALGVPGVVRSLRPETPCLPGHAHLRLPGVGAESVLIVLDRLGVSASSGAACSSGSLEPSHVLKATGLTDEEANEGVRLTFGRDQGMAEGRLAAEKLGEVYAQITGSGSRSRPSAAG